MKSLIIVLWITTISYSVLLNYQSNSSLIETLTGTVQEKNSKNWQCQIYGKNKFNQYQYMGVSNDTTKVFYDNYYIAKIQFIGYCNNTNPCGATGTLDSIYEGRKISDGINYGKIILYKIKDTIYRIDVQPWAITYFYKFVAQYEKIAICSLSVGTKLPKNDEAFPEIKAHSSGIYALTRDSSLYKVNSSPIPIITNKKVIGFNFDKNNKIWFTTKNALNQCDLDGSNQILNIKTGSIYNNPVFVVTSDTQFVYINGQQIFEDTNSYYFVSPFLFAGKDKIQNMEIDQDDNIWFNYFSYLTTPKIYYLQKINTKLHYTQYWSNSYSLPYRQNDTIFYGAYNTAYTSKIHYIPKLYSNTKVQDTIYSSTYKCTLQVADDDLNDLPTYRQLSSYSWLQLSSSGTHNAPCYISTNSIDTGLYTIKIQVADNNNLYDTIQWNLYVGKKEIQIISTPSITAKQDSIYSETIKLTDDDNISYVTKSIIPSWLNLTRISQKIFKLQGTPNYLNSDTTIFIIFSDSSSSFITFDTLSYNLTISKFNHKPTISSLPILSDTAESQYLYNVIASDVEDQNLTYSLTYKPTSMTIASNQIRWTPSLADTGSYSITIKVVDSQNDSAIQTYTLVIIPTHNNAPVITSLPTTSIDTRFTSSWSYTIQATDERPTTLSYALVTKPTEMTITSNIVSWIPTTTGISNVSLKVTDERNSSTIQNFSITVINSSSSNKPPYITTIPILSINEDTLFTQTFTATDSNNDPLSWTAPIKPSWSTFSDATLSGTPPINAGQSTVKIYVTDGMAIDSLIYTLTVNHVNHKPIITSVPCTTITVGKLFTYTLVAFDPDGDSLTYQILAKPTNMTVNNNILSWMPSASSLGKNLGVNAIVYDNHGSTSFARQIFHFTIKDTNYTPVITSIFHDTTINENDSIIYSLNTFEPDSSIPTITWCSNTNKIASNSPYIFKTDYNSSGVYAMSAIATDSIYSDTIHWVITVKNVNQVSVLSRTKYKTDYCNIVSLNKQVIVNYGIVQSSRISIVIYNLQGKILTKIDEVKNVGSYSISIGYTSSNKYIYKIQINKINKTGLFTLIR